MHWPWKKKEKLEVPTNTVESDFQTFQDSESLASFSQESNNDFSFYWFFLVFWLTVIATVLISWKMVV